MTRAPSPILVSLAVHRVLDASADSDPRPVPWEAHPPLAQLLDVVAPRPEVQRSRWCDALALGCGAAAGVAVVVAVALAL